MNTNGIDPRDPGEDEVRRLIEEAGPRPGIPSEDLDEIRAVAREAWRARVSSRRRRSYGVFAIAAALMIAFVGAALWMGRDAVTKPGPVIARWESLSGEVASVMPDETRVTPQLGGEVHEGESIEVLEGLAALRIGEGISLRLAESTTVHILADHRVELSKGVVYVDSGGAPLEVVTPFGEAWDIGTQFLVKVDLVEKTMNVSVRDGEVSVRHGTDAHAVVPGTRLTLFSDGRIERGDASRSGGEWAWVLDAAPGYEIEGHALSDYLDWISRETGLEIRYAEPAIEAEARDTTLHGSTGELRPDEAVLVVLPGAGLEGSIQDGVLEVRRPSE